MSGARLLAGLVLTVMVAACTGGAGDASPSADAVVDGAEQQETSAADGDAVDEEAPAAAEEPLAEPLPDEIVAPECEAAPGRTVTQLPDVAVPEHRIPAVVVPDTELDDGTIVEGFEIPEQVVPAQLVDGGCIIEHDAPGGCLGEVEITAATIPAVEIPAVTIPASVLPDGTTAPERSVGGRRVDARTVEGRTVAERCQRERGTVRPAIARPAIARPAIARPAVARPAITRPAVCSPSGCLEAVTVDAVTVDAVTLDAAAVDAAVLEAEVVTDDVERFDDDERRSYVAPADVLFDVDEATLRPEAQAALRAILDDLAGAASEGRILIEGHTDSDGSAAYNLDLSERRAASVAAWLVAEGGIDADRLETVGHGQASPAASNDTEDGRQRNRRVVITFEG